MVRRTGWLALIAALMISGLASAQPGGATASRTELMSANNLKLVALALHNYHAVNQSFPPPAIVDSAGKPLLSWRVALLPYLGDGRAEALYRKFHLGEPWDSPHNKALLSQMPKFYANPLDIEQRPTVTSIVLPTGPATIFPMGKGLKMADISDGTSQTILVIETKTDIPWTKPADWEVKEGLSVDELATIHKAGFVMARADGSVKVVKTGLDPKILWAQLTAAAGDEASEVAP